MTEKDTKTSTNFAKPPCTITMPAQETSENNTQQSETDSFVKIKYEKVPATNLDTVSEIPSTSTDSDKKVSRSNTCTTHTMHLKAKLKQLEPFLKPLHRQLISSDKQCRFYTNIPTVAVFKALCHYLAKMETHKKKPQHCKGTLHKYFTLKGTSSSSYKKLTSSVLTIQDRVLLTLMKLRLNLLHKDLADRFRISVKQVSLIFQQTLVLLQTVLSPMITFQPKSTIAKTLPKPFWPYPNLRCIIDCSEIFIQRPNDLDIQAATWSDYKHHNTLKFLIGITPQGSVCFLSELWGGRASDRYVTVNSGFLDLIATGDQVMADRGFPIKEELLVRGAELVIPPGKRGRAQMSSNDIRHTKKIANTRIHVERVIRRLKTFKLLSGVVPISLVPHLNHVIFVCAAVINMQGTIVQSWCEK